MNKLNSIFRIMIRAVASLTYLLLYSLFYLLVAAYTLTSCNSYSSSIQNPGLIIAAGDTIPDNWNLDVNNNFKISKKNINSVNKPILSSVIPGEISFSQTITLDSGEYFLLAKYQAQVEEGTFFIRANDLGSIAITSSDSVCERTLFSIRVRKKDEIKIEFGFGPGSIGQVLIESLFLVEIQYKFPKWADSQKKIALIKQDLGQVLQQDSVLARKIDLLAKSINGAFISTDIDEKSALVATYSSVVFDDVSTPYLNKYIIDTKIRDSYCQKSSLSLDELIRLYKIPTRQLHWQINCSGVHQFLEYWNTYNNRWEIIDPYYGIRYVDSVGNYLNFEGIEKLVKANKFTAANIKQMNIGRLYYNEKEIMDGWTNSGLAIHVINN